MLGKYFNAVIWGVITLVSVFIWYSIIVTVPILTLAAIVWSILILFYSYIRYVSPKEDRLIKYDGIIIGGILVLLVAYTSYTIWFRS
jgi:hypothetical protein